MDRKDSKSRQILTVLTLLLGLSGFAMSQVPVDENGTPIGAIEGDYDGADQVALLSAPELE